MRTLNLASPFGVGLPGTQLLWKRRLDSLLLQHGKVIRLEGKHIRRAWCVNCRNRTMGAHAESVEVCVGVTWVR